MFGSVNKHLCSFINCHITCMEREVCVKYQYMVGVLTREIIES